MPMAMACLLHHRLVTICVLPARYFRHDSQEKTVG